MPKLKSIAEIRAGATLRGRDATRPSPEGDVRFLRIGDLNQDGECRLNDLDCISLKESISGTLFLKEGDVLFPNRGTRTTSFVFPGEQPPTLVGSQFFIIRVKTDHVLPGYLAWFLRSPRALSHFDLHRKGSLVQTIDRNDIEDLEVPIPLFETQYQIVKIAELSVQARELESKLQSLQQQYLHSRLLNAADQFQTT